MAAYRDDGVWRYRKRIKLPSGKTIRIGGTPPVNTRVAADAAERAHIERELHPERVIASTTSKEVPTLKEYAVVFMAGYLPTQKPSERVSKNAILDGQLIPWFGAMRLDEIRQADVDAFVIDQLTRVEPKTIDNRLGVLSTLLGYALDNEVCTPKRMRCHIGGESAEIVAVPMDDVQRLLDACHDDRYRVAILLAAEAGLRVGEIRGLKWEDVDVVRGQITVRRAIDTRGNVTSPKHDKRRSIPTSSRLIGALATLRRRGTWVVGRLDGGSLGYDAIREAIHGIYTRSGVTPPTMPIHALRHTFGTQLAARGIPLPVIKDLMGHSSIVTTLRYVTVVDDQRRGAIAMAFGPAGQPMANRPPETSQVLVN